MSTGMVSSMDICPLNFDAFNKARKQIENIDAILLLSKLKFHQLNSKIKESGNIWIARSREQLSTWFGFSTKKVDRLLLDLSNKKHINKRSGMWYGEKRLFISATDTLSTIPINHRLFKTIQKLTGSIPATLVFSKIAFAFANSKIEHDGTKWCCLTEKELSDIANISLRTLDKITESLQKKGLVIKRKYCWREKYKTHYHIPEHVIKTILKNSKKDIFLPKDKIEKIKSLSDMPLIISQDRVVKKISSDPKTRQSVQSDILFESMTKTSVSLNTSPAIFSLPEKNTLYQNRERRQGVATMNTSNKISDFSDRPADSFEPTTNDSALLPLALSSSCLDSVKENTGKRLFCQTSSANLSLSIKLSTKRKKTTNNISVVFKSESETKKQSDISFYSIGSQLTTRQEKYLDSAMIKTITRKKIRISNPQELKEELVFSLLNPQQRKGIETFPHAVSHFMKILSSNNWKTPIGFHRYSETGQLLKAKRDNVLTQWEIQKKAECGISAPTAINKISNLLTSCVKPLNEHLSTMTDKAIQIAKKIANLDKERLVGMSADNCQSRFFDMLMDSLTSYLKQGANYEEIKKHLEQT